MNHKHPGSKDPDVDPGTDTVISPRSKVPLSSVLWVIACTISVCGSCYMVFNRLEKLEERIAQCATQISEMRAEINQNYKEHQRNDWSKIDQTLWAFKVRQLNSTNVIVPDVNEVWNISHQ